MKHRTRLGMAARWLGWAIVGVSTCIALQAYAATTWRAYTYNAAATVTAVKGLNALFDQIRNSTGNELAIRLNLGGTLAISATNITEAVAGNVVQMGDDAFFVGSVPVGGTVRLPLLIKDRPAFDRAWAAEEPFLKAAYEKKGIVLLGHYTFPLNVIWSRKKLTTLSDIAGQKIRVISPEQAEFIKRLGGIPVTLGTSEVAAALDRGVIDGVTTASSGYGYIWRDMLKYRYNLNVSFIDSLILANRQAWLALTAQQQAAVQRDIDAATTHISDAMAVEEDSLTSQLAAKGIVVTTPSAAEVAQATQLISPYWDTWAKARGDSAEQALTKVRAAIGR
ncbi:TRAP transporter substrate-binding protein DctP [Paraburkholderia sp. SG-MS1]|uniref:TRAP transporter substrate-binding protein DctP n=1 Tax=Paraburkholderia sp. SG-MS1 TaxID=2023741 RepID=UPI00144894C3|nr:TRAP transporter substrate-binding protein DctP [Paraburkholderia sp. SG-MS1]